MVDEFQDVNIKQYRLVSILSEYHKNLFVVGDPDQTVYSWRGANINLILNFDKEFKGTKTIMMNQNYRSSSNIIKASNSLISKNKQRIDKELIPIKHGNIPVVYKHSENIYKEANWIINQIEQIIKGGNSYKNIAILYRAHYVSRSIEEALLKIKFHIHCIVVLNFIREKKLKTF